MRKRILFIFLYAILTFSFAQKEGNIWIFAENCGLDFSLLNNSPTFFTISNASSGNTDENFNAISDSAGSLLFYIGYDSLITSFRGIVYNKDMKVMDNGLGHDIASTATNGSVIIPVPDEEGKFYLFYLGVSYNGLSVLKIDMKENGGKGKVINSLQLDSVNVSLTEKVIAIPHANGSDWWILTHDRQLNRFYRRLISKNQIAPPKFQDIGQVRSGFGFLGEYALGPRSESLVIVSGEGTKEWYQVSRCTGELSNYKEIEKPVVPSIKIEAYGCSISPSGRFLYVSNESELFQFDLHATDIKGSKKVIWGSNFSIGGIGQHQLGPDGKIYISIWSHDFQHQSLKQSLSVISQPDQLGTACDFKPGEYSLQGQEADAGLPSPPHYGLGPLPLPTADAGPDIQHSCPYDSSLLGSPAHPAYLYSWEPTTGLSDPHIAQPMASPTATTTYILTVIDTKHDCRNVNTDTITITVAPQAPSLTVDAGPDHAVACPGDKITVGLPAQPGWWYRWESDTLVSTDPQPIIQVDQPGWYYLIAGNDPENLCEYGIDSIWVDIEVPPLPEADAGVDRTICPGGGTWLEARQHANLSYYWHPDSLFADPTLPRQWLRPQQTQRITLQVTDITRDCHNVAYDTLHLKVEQIPYADAGPDMWLCKGLEMSDTIGTSPLPHTRYLWEPVSGLSDAFAAQPLVYAGADRIYHLTVIKDTFCVSHDSIHVLHKACDTPYFPTAFTPNGDGINDVFRITNLPGGCVFRVWNRWGRIQYERENYGNNWDGRNAPEGVYMYRLVEPDGREHVGSVTIIR